jgi:hypothetical protein
MIKHNALKVGSIGRGDRARTCDLTAPSRTRYQLRYTPKMPVAFSVGMGEASSVKIGEASFVKMPIKRRAPGLIT